MNLNRFRIALALILTTLSSNAFAIDHVVLKNGDIVEGKILNDVPNRYVDIELVNGTKLRYQQTDVSSVDRDIPSNTDTKMQGNTSMFYFGAQLGANLGLDVTGSTNFAWGARLGVNAAQMGDFAKLAIGVSYTNISTTPTTAVTVPAANAPSISDNQFMGQILFRKIANSGFYFGGEGGMDFVSQSAGAVTILTGNAFTYGFDTGFDFYLSPNFSLGPDIRYDRTGPLTISTTTVGGVSALGTTTSNVKIMITALFHL